MSLEIRGTWILPLALVLAACGPEAGPPEPDAARTEAAASAAVQDDDAAALRAADLEFARATAARGIEGWLSYFADDAARLEWKGSAHRGLAAIRAADGPMLSDPSVRLIWEPDDAGLFAGGKLGYTRGPYRLVRLEGGEPGPVLARGRYLSIWRLDAQGWRVILDTGFADPPPAAAVAPEMDMTP